MIGLLRHRSWRKPPPNFAWDFRRGVLHSAMSFSRASTAMHWNFSGVLTQAASGAPRFDYDPVTLQPLGYLSEMASTNHITRSEDFGHAAWSNDGGRTSVSANAIAAPDGTTTADKLIASAANTYHPTYWGSGVTVVANAPFGISIFVKAAEKSYFSLGAFGDTATKYFVAAVDLTNGTVSQTSNGADGTLISSNIRAVGGGWYRVSLVGSLNDTTAYLNAEIQNTATPTFSNYGNSTGWLGNGTDGLYIWGAQFETGGVGVTSYIPANAGSTVTRAQDVLTMLLSDLPGWSASAGGALSFEYQLHTPLPTSPGYAHHLAWLNDGSANNAVMPIARYTGDGNAASYFTSGGSDQLFRSLGAVSNVFTTYKMAMTWGTTFSGGSLNGAAVVGTAGSYSLPVAPTSLSIARYTDRNLQGTLAKFAFYANQRPSSFLRPAAR